MKLSKFMSAPEAIFVTGRAVFRLTPEGVALMEVAPRVDVEVDVLAQMDFAPKIDGTPATMAAAHFSE